jgi:hypothetical protein
MDNGFSKTSGNSLVNGDDNTPAVCDYCGEPLVDGICQDDSGRCVAASQNFDEDCNTSRGER